MKTLFSNKPSCEQEAVQPIKIVINIFTEHDELLQHLLPHIAPDFINYFYTYGNEVNSTFQNDVFKAGIKLIDSISTFFHILIENFQSDMVTMRSRENIEIIKMMEFIADTLLQRNID